MERSLGSPTTKSASGLFQRCGSWLAMGLSINTSMMNMLGPAVLLPLGTAVLSCPTLRKKDLLSPRRRKSPKSLLAPRKTSTKTQKMRSRASRTTTISEGGEDQARQFLSESSRYCPFILRAQQAGTVRSFTTNIDLDRSDVHDVSLAFVQLTERYLEERAATHSGWRMLLCYNVLFTQRRFSELGISALAELHWALKHKYTCQGVMFGKFWPDEDSYSSKHHRTMPNAPLPMISIRSAQSGNDSRFFTKSEQLLREYRDWCSSKSRSFIRRRP